VIATQNPVEMEGTYPLPEAQRDRFMARVSMGYPAVDAELRMISGHSHGSPLAALTPVADASDIVRLVDAVGKVHVSPAVARYAVDLVDATRRSPELRLGASPRATLHLVRASRAAAALDNRDYVLPDDLQALAVAVLAHRLLPTADAQMARRTPEQIVADIVRHVPVPGVGDARTPPPLPTNPPRGVPAPPGRVPYPGADPRHNGAQPYPAQAPTAHQGYAPVTYDGRLGGTGSGAAR